MKIRVESIQIRHRSGQRLNWMTVLRTCCIFREFERHKFRFEWRQCKFECWENKIEWRIGCAWPKSSKLNAHKMNLVNKITKLTGRTYINFYVICLYIVKKKNQMSTSEQWISMLDNKYYSIQFKSRFYLSAPVYVQSHISTVQWKLKHILLGLDFKN